MLSIPLWKRWFILLVCVFFTAAALPNVWRSANYPDFLPQQTVNLGLDLRGGSHLLLQIDLKAYLKQHFETLKDDVRIALRKEKIGYRRLAARDDAVIFTIRPETLSEGPDVTEIIATIDPDLTVKETQENEFKVSYKPSSLIEKRLQLLDQSVEIITRRINETGTKEPIIQRQGDDRVLVQVPGMENPEQLKAMLGKTAKMTFHLVNESVTPDQLARGIVPPGTTILGSDNEKNYQTRYPVYSRVALSGELLVGAAVTYSQGQPVVDFTFNTLGARKFGDITETNVGKRFAVVLDDKVITAPVIRSAILGGKGIIEGNFTVESANELAILLRAGALPAPMKIVEERSVGPSLGADSVAAGEQAVIIAVVAIMIFMLLYYGLFGIFSDIALLVNLIIILGALSLVQATLTLPGIAGIALTMGMAVDANTLIFERMREELASGKSLISAIDLGFKNAFGTIFDSNITTLIAACLLFYFGAGTVKGFAVTLSIGIISSMFTAILLTRWMVIVWYNRSHSKTLPF